MITLDTRKNISLTKNEEKEIESLCKKHKIDIENVLIIRNKRLKWSGAVACFSVLHRNTIYICNDKASITALLPHICHELKHREQFNRGKLSYLFLAIPILRRWTIEPEAYATEDNIRLKVNND